MAAKKAAAKKPATDEAPKPAPEAPEQEQSAADAAPLDAPDEDQVSELPGDPDPDDEPEAPTEAPEDKGKEQGPASASLDAPPSKDTPAPKDTPATTGEAAVASLRRNATAESRIVGKGDAAVDPAKAFTPADENGKRTARADLYRVQTVPPYNREVKTLLAPRGRRLTEKSAEAIVAALKSQAERA